MFNRDGVSGYVPKNEVCHGMPQNGNFNCEMVINQLILGQLGAIRIGNYELSYI